MPPTRAELIGRIRRRCDQSSTTFISDDEFAEIIDEALGELYDVVISTGQDYAIETYSFSGDASSNNYALPADFYKERGVDDSTNSNNVLTVFPFDFLERNEWQYGLTAGTGYYRSSYRYQILGQNIRILPVPATSTTFTLWYWPTVAKLVHKDSPLPDWVAPSWERSIIFYACSEAAVKDDAPEQAQAFEMKKDKVYAKIRSAAAERIKGEPATITDVRSIKARNVYPRV